MSKVAALVLVLAAGPAPAASYPVGSAQQRTADAIARI
jgi:hypothetical protein